MTHAQIMTTPRQSRPHQNPTRKALIMRVPRTQTRSAWPAETVDGPPAARQPVARGLACAGLPRTEAGCVAAGK